MLDLKVVFKNCASTLKSEQASEPSEHISTTDIVDRGFTCLPRKRWCTYSTQVDTEVNKQAHEHVYLQSTKTICFTYEYTKKSKTLSILSK